MGGEREGRKTKIGEKQKDGERKKGEKGMGFRGTEVGLAQRNRRHNYPFNSLADSPYI